MAYLLPVRIGARTDAVADSVGKGPRKFCAARGRARGAEALDECYFPVHIFLVSLYFLEQLGEKSELERRKRGGNTSEKASIG